MAAQDTLNETSHSTAKKEVKASAPQASVTETLSFVFESGSTVLFIVGFCGGVANGLVYPILAYLFSDSFSSISTAGSQGLEQVRQLAYFFMGVGTYALVMATIQHWCFELVGVHASRRLRIEWFKALLRQDPAYFDVHGISGLAAQIGPSANKYKRGVGRKFGEGIQFLTTGLGGIGFAFYSNWKAAFAVLSIVPLVSFTALMTVNLNQTKGERAAKAYKVAGGVAYRTVASIKTVLSLNAIPEMIRQYGVATQQAYQVAVSILAKQGLANGGMLSSFLMLYCILTLFGSFLLYRDVRDSGCDPSGGIDSNKSCDNTGPGVFGAMLGVAFAGQGISQFGNFTEAFGMARASVYDALKAMRRKPGTEEEIIYKSEDDDADMASTVHSAKKAKDVEQADGKVVKAILPKYVIDATSNQGQKPDDIAGNISVKNVTFCYPTRPGEPVIRGMSVEIKAGQTVAFVGPSGSGKSTIVGLLERFYDPQSGTVQLDNIDLKDINVRHLRSMIGYVGQEPTLFATTIRNNIKAGNPSATQEQIEAAARMANAHDFISSFSDGYDTQVGDKGSQLSGGQKQRIAIARILVGNPKLLLLDEATSALDAESELVVQEALDNIVANKKITTIIIAHRLSTIRNANMIYVVVKGELVEAGTHDELMAKEDYYYRLVQKQEGKSDEDGANLSDVSPSVSQHGNPTDDEKPDFTQTNDSTLPHIEFKDVVFSYPTRPKKPIFNGFNLKIQKGQTVALVGPSGGGKSTTVGLIERFYDPSGGSVEYLGHDIRSLNVAWYRDQIGYVGQEPVLFNDTVGRNIAYGAPNATQAEIEDAARQANAIDFINDLPQGFDTLIGERGTQLSGGQKQRVAIARALVKKPAFLILDEATSALDNESEAIVQAAIDNLMGSRNHTVILIAHRLSTIRNADKIALIADGMVIEYGSHDELMNLAHGRYKRLFEASKRGATITLSMRSAITKVDDSEEVDDDKEIDWEAEVDKEEEKAFDAKRARAMATADSFQLMVGSIGAVMAGGVFPMWGLVFASTINILFQPVYPCDSKFLDSYRYSSCEAYWNSVADSMQRDSYFTTLYWVLIIVGAMLGNLFSFVGFGTASERLNRRVRDTSFEALLRQEVAYFDKRSVGRVTAQLQDDAARIHAFSGEPVRAFLVAVSSVVTGLVLSFAFMWQFALLAIGCVPLMGFATSIEMKQFLGSDVSSADTAEGMNSPGGILVETLVNMRTVSALTLEQQRLEEYTYALVRADSNSFSETFTSGITGGLSMFIQQWINALQLWFGGWLLFTFPEDYEFRDFLIANFAILFALFGLGAAFQDISDKKEVEKSAGRIFYLLDRKSSIDPLSGEGKKLS